jgi:hypothetical protein
MAESSEDSELAAMLDEGLFPEDNIKDETEYAEVAEAGEGDGSAAAVAADSSNLEDDHPAQQAAKRPRTAADTSVENATNQQQAAEAICPPHPGWWMNMCIRCGATKPEIAEPASAGGATAASGGDVSSGLTKIKHLHHRQALEVSWLMRRSNASARALAEYNSTVSCLLLAMT